VLLYKKTRFQSRLHIGIKKHPIHEISGIDEVAFPNERLTIGILKKE
jgi:hypothetical protein